MSSARDIWGIRTRDQIFTQTLKGALDEDCKSWIFLIFEKNIWRKEIIYTAASHIAIWRIFEDIFVGNVDVYLMSLTTLMWIMMLILTLWCHWLHWSWCWCRWPHWCWCWCRWPRWCCWPFWCWCWCCCWCCWPRWWGQLNSGALSKTPLRTEAWFPHSFMGNLLSIYQDFFLNGHCQLCQSGYQAYTYFVFIAWSEKNY